VNTYECNLRHYDEAGNPHDKHKALLLPRPGSDGHNRYSPCTKYRLYTRSIPLQ